MSETKHTPGPWHCGQESVDPEWWIVTIKGGLIIANVNAHFRQEANARLIAAAPDILAALRECEAFCKGHQETPEKAARYERVRAAIAKAEGRP